MAIKVDPFDANTVYRATIRIFKTQNGGSNWQTLTNGWGSSQQVHQDTHVLVMHPHQQNKVDLK